MATLLGVLAFIAVLVLLVVGGFVYLAVVLAWENEQTKAGAYFRRPLQERRRFRSRLRTHARLLVPILRLGSRLNKVGMEQSSFQFDGIAGPKGSCTEESFRIGSEYVPRAEDVFVVTQMKSGTTWMQHLVYQVLSRGHGDLAEKGEALYAISPWLEGIKSISMDSSKLVGEERPSRIIKTHFPADVCPFSPEARYVYVVRHPVSCFASCVDFIAENLGAFAPDLDEIVDWYCSEGGMWWGDWPRHVMGWWSLARDHDNVFFVRFEDMKENLPDVALRLSSFLGMDPPAENELVETVRMCGFAYMQDHADSFEMQPPHLLAIDAELLKKGTADRFRDVPEDARKRVMEWCAERSRALGLPLAELYPS